ncbi:DeoR/GlpR family DNA-binding transcription regulator [Dyadobacter sp. Leaf189]|uniref:DeoR/GlpR family DNA-binding transcription regulator n=1 Tax=Dyadobacter sp. Leaf189 TaxID=1736295 RepID=UPI0006FCA7B5|nr:DeoR/GlpR family DNA-binding transcription regulator [Dyadobacter sp. Leaf189]KQS26812.1 DeoR family transcriptional regulator [Dyadobacter sp. Leaf189]
MTIQERKKKILAEVYEAGSLSVFELADKMAASPATIRRDLHEITEQGLLVRTHGGAMKPDNAVITGFSDKKVQRHEDKERIAQEAATLVDDGDTIFMDCGSTVFQMCTHLKKKANIHVITNSLPVLAELIDVPSIRINLIGGELDKKRRAVHGQKAIEHIHGYHAAKCFIGVDGISAENGLTAHSEHESGITSAYLQNASQAILLCDSSKIGRDSYIKFAKLSAISCLITDGGIEEQTKKALKAKGVAQLIVV